jgi:hypothetical protein
MLGASTLARPESGSMMIDTDVISPCAPKYALRARWQHEAAAAAAATEVTYETMPEMARGQLGHKNEGRE